MEPRETPSNRPSASLEASAPGEATGRQPGAPMPDPLERLGLVFFAAALACLFFVVPVVWEILQSQAPAVPVYEVTAVALDAAYETDAQAAQERYGTGQVSVTGSVCRFGREANGGLYVELAASERRVVRCLFSEEEPEWLVGLEDGKKVTVHGTCEGRGPSGHLTIRATDLR
ncbi:MAG TPA: hypothetical protein GX715_19430 [Armatimonadetes bacterium]|jgi:hypothetical protein|nr:hypothetical protein [Armatimonadota bacterium]